jgi:hypothetical protein
MERPFNPEIPLHFNFIIEGPDPSIFETISTGTKISEMLLTDGQGLNSEEIGEAMPQSSTDWYRKL